MNRDATPCRRGVMLVVMVALLALPMALTPAPALATGFTNSGPITIPDYGQSNPYPSAISVSGEIGAITDVDVTLTGISHAYSTDLDVLLVGPFGQSVVLLADPGVGQPIANIDLRLDDAAPTAVPAMIVSGTYRPTGSNFLGTPPAPAPPHGSALSVFNGTVPNGTWNLFVFDDAFELSGSIAGGWSLDIQTNGPIVSSFAPASGWAGEQVVIAGANLTGATNVTFGGIAAAAFTIDSATQITATVPAGGASGTIAVTTPYGTSTSAASFIVSVTPKVTLTLSGLRSGALELGKSVTAKGRVTPVGLSGSKIDLTVQKKRGARWVTVKTAAATISSTAAYSWRYRAAKRGAYRVRAAIAKSAATAAAGTAWRSFKVR